ncbi:WD40 repeat domain-containing protein, partial [Streptosporangium sp. NPDC002607]
ESVISVAFSPDGKTLASASGDMVRLWDVGTRLQIGAPLSGNTGAIFSVAFSPDGKTLASGGGDRTVRLWDVGTRLQIGAPLSGNTGAIFSVAFSPDGKPRSFNIGAISSVAFSPDGKTLASASVDKVDNTVLLWDTATRRLLGAPLTGHTNEVTSVAFSPDGKTLASASEDKTILLWNVALPTNLYAAACAISPRSLRREEWNLYIPGEKFQQVCP